MFVQKYVAKVGPFQYTPGRKCQGFSYIHPIPVITEDMPNMKDWVNHIIRGLTRGLVVPVEEEENEEEHDNW